MTAAPPHAADDRLGRLRAEVLAAVRRYATEAYGPHAFRPGETAVPVAGKVIGAPELEALVDASLDGWLTEGRFAERFGVRFAEVAGRRWATMVGSGSQANLLAVAAAGSHLHERPWRAGDEVITPAMGFPTTVNPLYQHGLVPVYVDVEPETLNPSLEAVAAAVGPRTRGVMMAHGLGNPFDGPGVQALCAEHELVLVEDCCDALGSTIGGRPVGTFGAAASYSFYPAHHMTTGEGGAVAVDGEPWRQAVSSLREWGRDCWCPPGVNDACGRRFDGDYGTLPAGYDHKYVFSHLGYNCKVTDMQAALGLAQIDRLEGFHARRRENFERLAAALARFDEQLVLPRSLPSARPSWFGFPLTLREGDPAQRRRLQLHLAERRIDSRLMLAGNMTRQPAYRDRTHRVAGPLAGADRLTATALWVGVYPGLDAEMVDFIAESIAGFLRRR